MKNPKLQEELTKLLNLSERDRNDKLRLIEGEHLLDLLDEERHKFMDSNKGFMNAMCDELVVRGIYPTNEGKTNNVYQMVSGWGARWHVWSGPFNCQFCGTDLRDQKAGPPFKREIGIYDRSRDRTVSYRCPDCNKEWPR